MRGTTLSAGAAFRCSRFDFEPRFAHESVRPLQEETPAVQTDCGIARVAPDDFVFAAASRTLESNVHGAVAASQSYSTGPS